MKRNLFRKIFVLIIIGLFFGVGIFSTHGISSSFYDRLDQNQSLGRTGWFFNDNYLGFAQSFKPTLDILSRVYVKFCKDFEILVNEIYGTIHLTIRDSLYGNDLTLKSISDNKITTSSLPDWIEFDFPDIDVIPGETYYIVCNWEGSQWGPKIGVSQTNNYTDGESWIKNNDGNWFKNGEKDLAFKTYGYNSTDPFPDLDYVGTIGWNNIKPGNEVTKDIVIINSGDSESELSWEIESYPDWGLWTFIPSNGDGLTPEDGPLNIEVNVIAPEETNKIFTGQIKIVNKYKSSDYSIIPVSLATTKNKPINYTFFKLFLDEHPLLFPILRQFLGL
jgi:hypothetical protein